MVWNALSASIEAGVSNWRRMWKWIQEQETSIRKTHERIPQQLSCRKDICKLAQFEKSAPTIRSLVEQARMPDVSVCVRQFRQKVATWNCGCWRKVTNPPQTDTCWKMLLEKRLFWPWPTNERWPWTTDNRCWRWALVVCQMVSSASWRFPFLANLELFFGCSNFWRLCVVIMVWEDWPLCPFCKRRLNSPHPHTSK